MKTSTLKQPFRATYQTPTCDAITLNPTKQILQGSIEPISGGNDPDIPWGN